MNREKVLQLAKEAEILRQLSMEVPFVVDRLERFAALIEAEVRGNAEPVAWRYKVIPPGWTYSEEEPSRDLLGDAWERIQAQPLYTHPAPAVVRQPLTSEDIFDIAMSVFTRIQKDDWVATDKDIYDFVRAIERAHGIGSNDE